MTNLKNNFADTTIVAFHIGRGGHYWNSGHLSFLGEERIGKYTNDLFLSYENAYEISKKINGRENLSKKFEQALNGDADALAFFEKIGMTLGQQIYADGCGSPVGLTVAEAEIGVGKIDIDGGYNTTYTKYLSNCTEQELRLIADYHGYINSNIVDYARRQLNDSLYMIIEYTDHKNTRYLNGTGMFSLREYAVYYSHAEALSRIETITRELADQRGITIEEAAKFYDIEEVDDETEE